MRLNDARVVAERIVRELKPACAQLAVVGSVRRRRPQVSDLELVVVSKGAGRPVFGDASTGRTALDQRLGILRRQGTLGVWHKDPKDGPKYKTFSILPERMKLDLFIADADNYGYLQAIRTGDQDFSRLLVTNVSTGGLLPDDLHCQAGYVWRGHTMLKTPTEHSFFALLGLTPPPAMARTVEHAQKLRAQVPAGALFEVEDEGRYTPLTLERAR